MLGLLFLSIVIGLYAFRSVLFRSFFNEASKEELNESTVLVIAHRGASGDAPENTLSAIKKAVRMESDLVEIDLHLTKDGRVIVFHDVELERTTNGTGKISETNWEDIESLDAGSWFSEEFKGEKVPLFEDVLKYVKQIKDTSKNDTQLLIEIKNNSEGNVYKGLAQKAIDLLLRFDDINSPWCIIQAFNSDYLLQTKEYLQTTDGKYKPELHKLMYTDFSPLPFYIDFTFRWGYPNFDESFVAVNPNYRSLTAGKVKSRHMNGTKVFTYTVNDTTEMKRLIAMGVDGIITNYPDRLVKLKKSN